MKIGNIALPWRYDSAANSSIVYAVARRAGCLRSQPVPLGASARHERCRQDREHAKGGDVPEQRADERYSGYVERGVSDAPADIGNRPPMGQLIVNACRLCSENRRGKEWKRLHVVAEVTVDAPGDGPERRHLDVARACSPFEAVLRVCGLRRSNELKEAPKTCSCQHH